MSPLSPLAVDLKTPRGPYRLTLARPPEMQPGATLLTLSLEHRDGIEKVAFQCRIDAELTASKDAQALLECLAPWVEREFETTREAALRSIRSERKLFEVVFDESRRGPF